MMGKQMEKKRLGGRGIAMLVTLLGLTACAMAERPGYGEKPPTSDVVREVTLQFTEDGSIRVKAGEGAIVDKECSLDPDAKDACPIYDKDKRIHVDRIEPVILMKYHGSPVCYLVGQYSQARLICYPF